VLPEERLEVALDDAVDDGVLDDGLPGGVAAVGLSLPGLGEVLDVLLDALLNLAFFSTKLSPRALLGLALLDGLALVSVVDDPLARCRQPVALVEPAAGAEDGCCEVGGDAVGLWAASVPHRTTAVLSVPAHCHWCVCFMTYLLHVRM
jgi:hypothetical protein